VEIRIGNRVLDTLSPGNIFGEMAGQVRCAN